MRAADPVLPYQQHHERPLSGAALTLVYGEVGSKAAGSPDARDGWLSACLLSSELLAKKTLEWPTHAWPPVTESLYTMYYLEQASRIQAAAMSTGV